MSSPPCINTHLRLQYRRCGHCKKLAPTWTQLAKEMEHKLAVAEVNCDENSSLCKSQDVTGYPMLFFYANGAKSEYSGGLKLEQLRAFAERASAPCVELSLKLVSPLFLYLLGRYRN